MICGSAVIVIKRKKMIVIDIFGNKLKLAGLKVIHIERIIIIYVRFGLRK